MEHWTNRNLTKTDIFGECPLVMPLMILESSSFNNFLEIIISRHGAGKQMNLYKIKERRNLTSGGSVSPSRLRGTMPHLPSF